MTGENKIIKKVDSNSERQKYKDVFRQSPISIEIYGADGKLEDVNQACLDLFGIESADEVKGTNLFTNPNLSQQAISDIQAGKAVKYELAFDFGLVKSHGLYKSTKEGICFLECYIYPTLNDHKQVTGYIVHSTEITERKRIEEALTESELKYRNLIEYSGDPIFSFNPDETYRFVNEAFARHFNKNPEDIIGKTPHAIFSYDEAEKRLALVRKVFRTGQKGEIEVGVETPSGEVFYFLTMADPIKNDVGEVIYVTCVSKNITKRRQAEEALKKSEEKFRRIVESSTRGMYFYQLDNDDRLILVGANPSADRIIGYDHQKLIGKTIEELFPKLIEANIPDLYRKIAKGESEPIQFDLEYSDDKITGYYNVHVYQTEKNNITVNFTDITERKKVELLLAEQARELNELNATKDKFLSIIAHDLKNPFNAIFGFSELMLKNFYELDDETLLKGLENISSASGHAYKLLENLLIWTQNQTGLRQFIPEKLDLKTQITESLGLVEANALAKNIRITASIKHNHTIFADKNMLDSILRNLISNAIKFTNKGGKIKIKAIKTETEFQISVSDNGIGISPEKLDDIFRIDKHIHTNGTDGEMGTGLGLLLCNDFAIRHGGKIWAESTPGKGSKFTFCLPAIDNNN